MHGFHAARDCCCNHKAYFFDNGDPRLRRYRTMEVVEQVGTGMQEHVLREDEQVQDNQGFERFVQVSVKSDVTSANYYDVQETRELAQSYHEEMEATGGRGYEAANVVDVDAYGEEDEEEQEEENEEEENEEEQEDEDDRLDAEQREEMQRLTQQREQQPHGANAPLKRKIEERKADSCQFMLSGWGYLVDPPPPQRPCCSVACIFCSALAVLNAH